MPISTAIELGIVSEAEFHRGAEKIIGLLFALHNDLGRLMDEEVYQRTFQSRIQAESVHREVEIFVQHADFTKSFFMDLVVNDGVMVETKTVESLTHQHHAQALHYLLLTGMQHGLLVNLRAERVEKQFVSTTLTLDKRREFDFQEDRFASTGTAAVKLHDLLIALLSDWGAFLQTSLYKDAVVHFFGGPGVALRRIPIREGKQIVGSQEVCLIDDQTAFAITALKQNQEAMRDHLSRFLRHTDLRSIVWFNMNNHDMDLVTIGR